MRKTALRAIRGAAMATVVASLTIAMTSLPTVAQADDNRDSTESLDVTIPTDSILATPEEVTLLGGTPDETRTQEQFWAALPADVAQEQATLNAAEHSRYQAAFDNIIPASMDSYVSREVAAAKEQPLPLRAK